MEDTSPPASPETPEESKGRWRFDETNTILPKLCERYPKAFVTDPEATMPLALGLHKQLLRAGYKSHALFKAFTVYTNSRAYLEALAAGKPRVNLDGEPVGAVSEEHQQEAAHELAHPGTRQPRTTPRKLKTIALAGKVSKSSQSEKKSMPSLQLKGLQAKIAVTIDSATFKAALGVDTMGVKAVPVSIDIDGKTYTASLNPKSFRKAQVSFQEAAQPVVSISGNLKGDVIDSAGILVFDKGSKQAKEGAAEPPKAPAPAAMPPVVKIAKAPPKAPPPPPEPEAPLPAGGGNRPKLSLKPKAKE